VSDALIFLTADDVVEIHDDLIASYGGAAGTRDMGLLESAIAQPQSTFGGEFLHKDIASMAAAYLFSITKNHAFVDGNKRTGAAVAIIFLKINGCQFQAAHDEELAEMTERIAAGQATVDELTTFLRDRIVEL
jgi:death-on-curing protein